MAKKHEPLDVGPEPLSPAKMEWLATELKEGLIRLSALMNVLTRVPNAAGTHDVAGSFFLSSKGLFDGEPARVVAELEVRWPHFFDGFPCRGVLNDVRKRAFIGEWCKAMLGGGKRRFGKPGLRKPEAPDDDMGDIL